MCSNEITTALSLNGVFVQELGTFMSFQLLWSLILLYKHIGLGFISNVLYYLERNK